MNPWQQRAARLAELLPVDRLHPEVLRWLGTATARRGALHVALSGGADSVCLLLLLWAHFPRLRGRLRVLHFNHRLRGRESGLDARFCAALARGLGLAFQGGVWKGAEPDSSEAKAREARLAFFEDAMAGTGPGRLLLGHQLDDVAESLLMRVARGSGLGGLAAPRPLQKFSRGRIHLRPLLALARSEIRSALERLGIPWREDSSNPGTRHLRNRMRADVVPSWIQAARGRDALAGAGLTRELIAEAEEALEAWLEALQPLERGARLRLEVLKDKPVALWRLALHRWLAATPYRGDLSRQGFELLLRGLVEGRLRRQSLGAEGFAVVEQGMLRFERRSGRAVKKR